MKVSVLINLHNREENKWCTIQHSLWPGSGEVVKVENKETNKVHKERQDEQVPNKASLVLSIATLPLREFLDRLNGEIKSKLLVLVIIYRQLVWGNVRISYLWAIHLLTPALQGCLYCSFFSGGVEDIIIRCKGINNRTCITLLLEKKSPILVSILS